MTKAKKAVALKEQSVALETKTSDEASELLGKISELGGAALSGLLTQNLREIDIAVRTAEALYNDAPKGLSADERLFIEVLVDMISLYNPLVRAFLFQAEGRFARGGEELARGLDMSAHAIAKLDRYIRISHAKPEVIKDILHMYKPSFAIFSVLFRGMDASIRAEVVGYSGKLSKYKELLREAVTELRQAERLPSTSNQLISVLVGMCTAMADRLETRIEVFGSEQGQQYIEPTGSKIFIVHGHDEAKWRELRELLEDEFKLNTVILKEEAGAGETLIKKFESFASDCCYAFALFTPDDFMEKEGKSYLQARPNVVFEIGWFCGRFGRDRICIIKKAKTEMPSDLAGILSIDFQEKISEVVLKIKGELQRAGLISNELPLPFNSSAASPRRRRVH